MTFIYHASTALKVNRVGDVVQVECTLLNNNTEASAWVFADVKTLQIQQAAWALYRSDDRELGVFELPQLIGVEAYLNAGPILKSVLGGPGQEMPRALVADCFRVMVQAETFFFEERGYKTAEKYVEFWHQNYAGLCRYYSHFEQIDKHWPAWLANTKRSYNLFNRSKTITIQRQLLDFIITASFIDSFHHVHLEIRLDQFGQVQTASGNFINAPHKNCHENTEHLSKIIGLNLPALSKREIAALVGGPDGCTHLLELIGDAASALAVIPPFVQ